MKANEAPERIWINSPQELPCGFVDNNSVEYIRTDAFIEKACEFLANDANIPIWEGYNDTFGCATELLIKNFKKYMKGE